MKFLLVLCAAWTCMAYRHYQLDSESPSEEARCSAGETVTFHIPANPTTGYTWFLIPSNSMIAQPLNGFAGDFHPSGTGMIGAGGEQEFILQCWSQAKPNDTYSFRLEKRRGYEPEPAKAKQVTLTVE